MAVTTGQAADQGLSSRNWRHSYLFAIRAMLLRRLERVEATLRHELRERSPEIEREGRTRNDFLSERRR